MNHRLICKILSLVLLALTAIFLLCLAGGTLWERSAAVAWRWFFCVLISGGLAFWLRLLGRSAGKHMFYREAFALTAFAWILIIALGTFPYLFFVPRIGLAGALFESASGFTSTGATVLQQLESLPRSLLLFRSMTQWIGGLGIVLFFVAFLSSLDGTSKVLFSHESTQNRNDIDVARVQNFSFRLMLLYLALTGGCIGCYHWAGMGVFDALCHGLTTVSTGGFTTHSSSLAAFSTPAIQWTAVGFMVLGGTNFVLLLNLCYHRWTAAFSSCEFRTYVFLLLFFSAVIAAILHFIGGVSFPCFRLAIFHTVSFMTSTGFFAADYGQWIPSCQLLLLLAMVIGGCSGSTAGGLKVIRLAAAVRLLKTSAEKTFRQHLVRPIYIDGQVVSERQMGQFIHYIFLFAVATLLLLPIYAILEPRLSFSGTMGTFFSALTNSGAAFAEFGPSGSFAALHGHSKIFLSFLMLLGRLEMNAILVLFIPSFWKQFS